MSILECYRNALDVKGEYDDIEKRINRLRQMINRTSNAEKIKALKKQISYLEDREAVVLNEQCRIQQIIDAADLSLRDRRLLNMRYIDRLSWLQIAMRFNVDEHVPRRWHKKLLASLAEMEVADGRNSTGLLD